MQSEKRLENEYQQDPQTSPERIGNFTASVLHAAIKKGVSGKYNKIGRQTLLDIKGSELDTGVIEDGGSSRWMDNGVTNEPIAKQVWQELTGRNIIDVPPYEHKTLSFFAASPDGVLEDDPSCLVEIKSPKAKEHRRTIRTGEIKDEYKTQMLAQIACMWHEGARKCLFISYHKLYTPKIHVIEFKPTKKMITDLEAEVIKLSKELVKDNLQVRKNQWHPEALTK